MGVKGLWQLINVTGEAVPLESLDSKVLSIDISLWLNQAIKGRVTGGDQVAAALETVFHRICKLLYFNVKPVFVFDGCTPELKKATVERRRQSRKSAEDKAAELRLRVLRHYMRVGADKFLETLDSSGPDDGSEIYSGAAGDTNDAEPAAAAAALPGSQLTPEEISLNARVNEYLEGCGSHGNVNPDSEEFQRLPQEVQYHVLLELTSSKSRVLNEQLSQVDTGCAESFSTYQFAKLLHQSHLTRRLDELRKRMTQAEADRLLRSSQSAARSSGKAADWLASGRGRLALSKIASQSEAHALLIRGSAGSNSRGSWESLGRKEVSAGGKAKDEEADEDEEEEEEDQDEEADEAEGRSSTAAAAGQFADDLEEILDDSYKAEEPLTEEQLLVAGGTLAESRRLRRADDDRAPGTNELMTPVEPDTAEPPVGVPGDSSADTAEPPVGVPGDSSADTAEPPSTVPKAQTPQEANGEAELEQDEDDEFVEVPMQAASVAASTNRTNSAGRTSFLFGSNAASRQSQRYQQEQLLSTSDETALDATALASATRQQLARVEARSESVSQLLVDESRRLISLFGLPFVLSPGEAEAQCARLEQLGLTQGTITDDSDVWLFGASRVYRFVFSRSQQVRRFSLDAIRRRMGLDRRAMVELALMCGSDYTDGVPGLGPVTAMEILAEFGSLAGLRRWLDERPPASLQPVRAKALRLAFPPDFPPRRIADAYLSPAVDSSDEAFTWGRPDLDLLRRFAADRLGWSRERCDGVVLPLMRRIAAVKTQSLMDKFVIRSWRSQSAGVPAASDSVRVNRAVGRLKTSSANDGAAASAAGGSSGDEPARKSARTSRRKKR